VRILSIEKPDFVIGLDRIVQEDVEPMVKTDSKEQNSTESAGE
jgi:hypothetical protein